MPSIHDKLTKHQIFLQRYAGGLLKNLKVHLSNSYNYVEEALQHRDDISRQEIANVLAPLKQGAVKELKELSIYEQRFVAKLISKQQKANIYINELDFDDITLSGQDFSVDNLLDSFIDEKSEKISQSIKDSKTNQEENSSLVVKALIFGGILYSLKSLTNTLTNHVANTAKINVYKQMPKVRWVAILDNSVCEDCQELDGSEWDPEDAPIPPEHWNCRCHIEPVLEETQL